MSCITKYNRSGFTLIELSLVLVIVGLIVSGVLVGRNLIAAAALRAQLTQIERFNTATNTFSMKYHALPGDMAVSQATSLGLNVTSCDGDTGKRDGNQIILGGNTNTTRFRQTAGETSLFWSDLSSSIAGNLIEGTFTASPGCLGDPLITNYQFENYWPQAKIGRGNSILVIHDLIYGTSSNYFAIVKMVANGGHPDSEPGLTVAEAFIIDGKIDDANPVTGRVVAVYPTLPNNLTRAPRSTVDDSTTCFNSNTDAYSMSISSGSNMNCALSLRIQ